MKKLTAYFTKGEFALWGFSWALIVVSFLIFDRVNYMTLAASLIGNTDLYLPLVGIELPMNPDVAYFFFFILYLALQLAAYYFLRNRLEVTYALVYDSLKPEEPQTNGVVLGNIFQM